MPYIFEYRDTRNGRNQEFACILRSKICGARTSNNRTCNKTCVLGLPFCWIHLISHSHIKIAESNIPNSGKGLFAVLNRNKDVPVPTTPQNRDADVVFRRGDIICFYDGEIISPARLNYRYGNFRNQTAKPPYAIQINQGINTGQYEDGACERGVGNFPNHASGRASNAMLVVHNNRVAIEAKKKIRHGQEITVNYYYPNYVFRELGLFYNTKYFPNNSTKTNQARAFMNNQPL